MDRNLYLAALGGLGALLNAPDASESACQVWFEQQQALIFPCLGFRRVIAHPVLKTAADTDDYISDLIAERHDGTLEIIEIKRPCTRTLKKATRREAFYAELQTYISQCFEYAEFFDDSDNRLAFERTYGLQPHKGMNSTLVAGRSLKLDRQRVSHLLSRYSNRIRHSTYDDIKSYIEHERAPLFAPDEGLHGLSINLVIRLQKASGSNFILDVGADEYRNRISIFADSGDQMTFQIFDDGGERWAARMRPRDLPYDRFMLLSFELGFARGYTILTVEVNGRYFIERKLDCFPVRLHDMHHVLGSDLNGKEESRMDVHTVLIFPKTLAFHDKEQLKLKFGEILDDCTSGGCAYCSCDGGRFMHTRAHPNFRGKENKGGNPKDLIQIDPTRQPKLVIGQR